MSKTWCSCKGLVCPGEERRSGTTYLQAAFLALIYILLGYSFSMSVLNSCYPFAHPQLDIFFFPPEFTLLAFFLKLGQSLRAFTISRKKEKKRWTKAKKTIFQNYSFNLSEVLMSDNSFLKEQFC